MKIRTGFVSNSSSSSFCVYGAYVDYEKFDELLKEQLDILASAGIEEHGSPYEDDTNMIGRSWTSIKDDETGRQFKDSVEAAMKQVFGEDIKCSSHEEGWYNG
jgi:hypothetical protein